MISETGEFVKCGYPKGMNIGGNKGRIFDSYIGEDDIQAIIDKHRARYAYCKRRGIRHYLDGLSPEEKATLVEAAVSLRKGQPYRFSNGEAVGIHRLLCGLDKADAGAYIPSQKEIREGCARIQAKWSEAERESRLASAYRYAEAIGVHSGITSANGRRVSHVEPD